MILQLQNKIALVTGSTAGIGESVAKTLAQEGARIVIHGRKADAAKRVAAEIIEAGGQATSVLDDLADDEQAAQVAKAGKDAFGQVDILINRPECFRSEAGGTQPRHNGSNSTTRTSLAWYG
jgi:3-oxoacyl-[acyl-carrier protein] reductase